MLSFLETEKSLLTQDECIGLHHPFSEYPETDPLFNGLHGIRTLLLAAIAVCSLLR
jgi:hypothetical protein